MRKELLFAQPLVASKTRSGSTLLEAVFYLVLLIIVAGPLMAISLTSQRSVADGIQMTAVAERNWVALNLLASDLQKAVSGSIKVSDSGQSLLLTPAVGLNGADLVPGNPVEFQFRSSQKLLAVDDSDSGGGAIYACSLIRVDKTSGSEQILSGYLATGSSFYSDGDTVIVKVVTAARTNQKNGYFRITRSLVVKPRN